MKLVVTVDQRPEPHVDGGSVGGQIDGGAGAGERSHVGQVVATESGADPEIVGCYAAGAAFQVKVVEAREQRAARRRAGDRGRGDAGLGVGVVVVELGCR